MNIQTCFVLLALLSTATFSAAQTYKCKDANGKTIYSDAACEFKAATVNTQDNTIARTEAERFRDQAVIERNSKKATDGRYDDAADKACKFSYYALSDEKGKQLAAEAKEECLQNYRLKRDGQHSQASFVAYGLWKDHKVLGKRAAPVMPTFTPLPTPANPISLKCTRNIMGDGMNCKE